MGKNVPQHAGSLGAETGEGGAAEEVGLPGVDAAVQARLDESCPMHAGGLRVPPPAPVESGKKRSALAFLVPLLLAGGALAGVGAFAPSSFMEHFTVFVLACFVGYMVIWNVSPALHTPLMSVTNAISSIIIIGALMQISKETPVIVWLAAVAILITAINIVGGFAVTQRMLEMFRKD